MYFTVCIPVYNRAGTVARTLESLEKQDFKDFEVIVVDDGSSDNSRQVVESFADKLLLKYVYKSNGGKHTALNKGIDIAEGEFFFILDSDDWLKHDALKKVYSLCESIKENPGYSGVMCRCESSESGQLIGDPFPYEPFISSYIDFHYISGMKRSYLDCFEVNKTSIIKGYRYPEPENTRFVPESWIFDQIGIKHKLLCTNHKVKIVEYLVDGITNDKEHIRKNIVGYLYDYVSKIDNVFPYVKISKKAMILQWWKYWNAVKIDREEKGPRVKHVTLVGATVRLFRLPISMLWKFKTMCLVKSRKIGRF